MNKKLFVLFSILLIVSLALGACSAPAEAPAPAEEPAAEAPAAEEPAEEAAAEEPAEEPEAEAEVVTLEWWTVASEEYTDQVQLDLAKAFEAEHPNIKVNVTILPEGGFSEKMDIALGAGEGAPDLAFFWDSNWFPEALDLTPYIEADADFDPSMYVEGFWNTRSVWNDKIVGLPLGVGAQFVMYNKDVFDKAGVAYPSAEWTTADYLDLVTQLNDPTTKSWGGDRPRRPFRALWFSHGENARLYSPDSMTVDGYFNSPESLAAYLWAWDLVNSDSTPTPADIEVLGTEGTGPIDLFMAGRLAMATLNQGHMLNAVEAGVNFGVVPEPGVEGQERYVNAWSLTSSIWAGTEHPQEAWEFLSYWVGEEGQRFLMENGNLFPSIPSVMAEYKDADEQYAQDFFKVLEYPQVSVWRNAHPCNTTVLRAVGDVWDKIMLGAIDREDIEAELDAMVPAAQDALDECRPRLGG